MGGTGESFAHWMGNVDPACPLGDQGATFSYFCIGIEGSSARRLDHWPSLASWTVYYLGGEIG